MSSNEKYENLVLNLNDAQNKYFKRFNKMPTILFLSSEHWSILSDGMLESECRKTSFSSIEIAISKISNRSYFSGDDKGVVDVGFISEVKEKQWKTSD